MALGFSLSEMIALMAKGGLNLAALAVFQAAMAVGFGDPRSRGAAAALEFQTIGFDSRRGDGPTAGNADAVAFVRPK